MNKISVKELLYNNPCRDFRKLSNEIDDSIRISAIEKRNYRGDFLGLMIKTVCKYSNGHLYGNFKLKDEKYIQRVLVKNGELDLDDLNKKIKKAKEINKKAVIERDEYRKSFYENQNKLESEIEHIKNKTGLNLKHINPDGSISIIIDIPNDKIDIVSNFLKLHKII